MAYIWSVATALPPHVIDAATLKRLGATLFGDTIESPAAFERLVDHTHIERRHLVRPPEELLAETRLEVRSEWYREGAIVLARQALAGALAAAGTRAAELDALVLCSATGFTIPSIDAYLIDDLGLRRDVRRLPFSTLGCAGGVGGVIRGADAAAALGPDARVAVVTVETPTLTFRPGDRSMANLISALIFGDGAAAVILGGRPPRGRPCLRVRASQSHIFPHSYDVMGFRLTGDGFRVLLSPEVPGLAARAVPKLAAALARDAGATPSDLAFHVLHPGGTRVLQAVEQALRLPAAATRAAWSVLRAHGNMSSPTVLFVLAETLRAGCPAPGSLGLMAAFGPGFAAEAALLEAVAPCA